MKRFKALGLFCIIMTIANISVGKTIDLRTSTDADGTEREISYCARPSPDTAKNIPGHAFLVFGVIPKKMKPTFRAIGHTTFSPGAAIVSFTGLLTADGAVVEERYTSVKQQCLVTKVNKAAYDAAYASANQPLGVIGIVFDETQPYGLAYSLGVDDCMNFMISVAKRFMPQGLQVPARGTTELPMAYIRRMIDFN